MHRSIYRNSLATICFAGVLLFTVSCININMPQAPAENKTSKGDVAVPPAATVELPAIESFSASPASVLEGKSSTLSWSVNNANAVTITPNIGNVSATGSKTVTPSAATTYTLVASNAAGMQSKTVVINILTVRRLQTDFLEPIGPGLVVTLKPDLIVEEFNVYSNNHKPYCIVRNAGTASSKACNVCWGASTIFPVECRLLPAIEPGKAEFIAFDLKVPDTTYSDNVTVHIDDKNIVDELNENNNTKAFLYTE